MRAVVDTNVLLSPDGRLLMSWGEPGTDPGQFNVPHNICCDPDGWVYVADRENHRVQVFDGDGKFETQWNNLHRRTGCAWRPAATRSSILAKKVRPERSTAIGPTSGRASAHTHKDEVLARLGKMHTGLAPGQFTSPHGIAVDGHGDIYVGELSARVWARLSKEPTPKRTRVIHKLVKTAA